MDPTFIIGKLNISWGWIWMVMGITSGSIIGLWSFAGPMTPPPGYRDYADLPRRLTRLAHIAMFALPLICVSYGHHIDGIPLSYPVKLLGSYSMIICMLGIPTFLLLASFYIPFKYLLVIPVSAGFIAFFIMAYGHFLIIS